MYEFKFGLNENLDFSPPHALESRKDHAEEEDEYNRKINKKALKIIQKF